METCCLRSVDEQEGENQAHDQAHLALAEELEIPAEDQIYHFLPHCDQVTYDQAWRRQLSVNTSFFFNFHIGVV